MQKLPIGIQSFSELRKGGFLYVDKTQSIYELTEGSKYYFLSRPRRFGKSLLLSTIGALFLGQKELFQGLWIEDKWNWNKKHPVLHIPFASLDYKVNGLEVELQKHIQEIAHSYRIALRNDSLKNQFEELLRKLSEKEEQVVLLIDEYDKPIIDYLGGDIGQARENQQVLKNFYSVIKDSDPYLRLVFITGVSKFSKVSIFSDLNNLYDLTIHDRIAAKMLGYTQEELESCFEDYITYTASQLDVKEEALIERIREWYNGYSWDGQLYVYNPFSILNFFQKGVFLNYWFKTATPAFLIELVRKEPFYDFDGIAVGEEAFDAFELREKLDLVMLFFQTGYLTIKAWDRAFGLYTLGYPNREVKSSMLNYLAKAFADVEASEMRPLITRLREYFLKGDIAQVVSLLNGLFKRMPYQLKAKTEVSYHALVHIVFHLLGMYMRSEVNTLDGRADAIVETEQTVYCMEFKLDKSAKEALKQIKERGYLEGYRPTGKKNIAIGINFSSEKGCIDDWEMEAC